MPMKYILGPILGHRTCRRLGMHQQIIWDALKGLIWPQGAIPNSGHICCIRLILGPERGYLNPLVQENHCKYDQSGWSYKYLETHVFRCAKKKNPKKSFFIIFMGSNLVKMPAQTQLAVYGQLG